MGWTPRPRGDGATGAKREDEEKGCHSGKWLGFSAPSQVGGGSNACAFFHKVWTQRVPERFPIFEEMLKPWFQAYGMRGLEPRVQPRGRSRPSQMRPTGVCLAENDPPTEKLRQEIPRSPQPRSPRRQTAKVGRHQLVAERDGEGGSPPSDDPAITLACSHHVACLERTHRLLDLLT